MKPAGTTVPRHGQTWEPGRLAAVAVLVGLLIAGAGQVLLTPLDMRSRGRLVYGIALIIVFIVALRTPVTGSARPEVVTQPGPRIPTRAVVGTATALLFASIAASLVAIGQGTSIALAAWGASLIAVLLGAGLQISRPVGPELRSTILIAACLTAALLLRVPALETVPPDVHIDEATMALETRKVLRGEMPAMLALGWDQYPSLGFALHAPMMMLAGDSLLGFRLTSVIGGVVTIGLTAALARLLFGGFAAIVAGALITFSHWHIHLSRMGLHYMDAVVFSLASIYLAVRGVLRGGSATFAAAGIALGMCFYVYYTARLATVIVAGVLLLGMLMFRAPWVVWGTRLAWLLAGALVTLAPLLVLYVQNPAAAAARSERVSIFSARNFEFVQRTYRLERVDEVLRFQAQRAVEMFNLAWDTSGQFSSRDPLLDHLSAVFFAVGCVVVLARLFTFSHALLLGWLAAALAAVTLTNGIPFSPRAIIALPAVILLATAGICFARDALGTAIRDSSSRWFTVALPVFLGVVAVLNYWSYFQRYIDEWHPAGFATTAGWLIAAERLEEPVVVIGGQEASNTIDIIRFLAPHAVYSTRFRAPYETSGATFVIDARTPDADGVIASIAASAASLQREPRYDPTGRLLLTIVRVQN